MTKINNKKINNKKNDDKLPWIFDNRLSRFLDKCDEVRLFPNPRSQWTKYEYFNIAFYIFIILGMIYLVLSGIGLLP